MFIATIKYGNDYKVTTIVNWQAWKVYIGNEEEIIQ